MWNWIYYAWRVIVNLASIAIILYVFSRLHDRFEILLVALSGVLYVTIRSIGQGLYVVVTTFAFGFEQRMSELRALLGDKVLSSDEFDSDFRKFKSIQTRIYIDYVAFGVVSLICLYYIFKVI